MNHATVDTAYSQELPFPLRPRDRIIGDNKTITFKTYVKKSGLVRYYNSSGEEQAEGLASFKEWLVQQGKLTIERE